MQRSRKWVFPNWIGLYLPPLIIARETKSAISDMPKSENSKYSPNAEAHFTYANLYVASYRHPHKMIGEKIACHSAISVTSAIKIRISLKHVIHTSIYTPRKIEPVIIWNVTEFSISWISMRDVFGHRARIESKDPRFTILSRAGITLLFRTRTDFEFVSSQFHDCGWWSFKFVGKNKTIIGHFLWRTLCVSQLWLITETVKTWD